MIAGLLAHQGGWDEVLFVAIPIAVFAALLAVANRRAARIEQQRQSDDPTGGPRDSDGGAGGAAGSTGSPAR